MVAPRFRENGFCVGFISSEVRIAGAGVAVVPEFLDEGGGVPHAWIARVICGFCPPAMH